MPVETNVGAVIDHVQQMEMINWFFKPMTQRKQKNNNEQRNKRGVKRVLPLKKGKTR